MLDIHRLPALLLKAWDKVQAEHKCEKIRDSVKRQWLEQLFKAELKTRGFQTASGGFIYWVKDGYIFSVVQAYLVSVFNGQPISERVSIRIEAKPDCLDSLFFKLFGEEEMIKSFSSRLNGEPSLGLTGIQDEWRIQEPDFAHFTLEQMLDWVRQTAGQIEADIASFTQQVPDLEGFCRFMQSRPLQGGMENELYALVLFRLQQYGELRRFLAGRPDFYQFANGTNLFAALRQILDEQP